MSSPSSWQNKVCYEKWIQVREGLGKPIGLRKDGPHSFCTHNDLRALRPHSHVPEVTDIDGTPWFPINY